MATPHFLTIAEQAAAYLRSELLRGRWSGAMPGMNQIATELGINAKTAEAALLLLEKQKLLQPQGRGKRRRIVLPEDAGTRALKVTILPYEPVVMTIDYIIEIRHRLQQMGHLVDYAAKDLMQLRMEPKRVAQLVEKTGADAWIVVAGSHKVMEWFASQPKPTFALFGRALDLPLPFAGPRKGPALTEAVGRLVALGHRRIVLLTREERRKPFPGELERLFLDELKNHGLPVGPYNLPDWQDSLKGFHQGLASLFRHTPPTAIIVSEPTLFLAAQQYLARNGLVAPRDVSMMCLDSDSVFAWCDPPITHIRWDPQLAVRRVVRWASNIAHGKDDGHKSLIKAEFIEGGTIGPAP
ncbi:MAG TPA: substrate-binding domain-containing protein, partial [Luteolibacter sp.]|nr:substrate-binding domain-containing protein [Luteolibacter sp.]